MQIVQYSEDFKDRIISLILHIQREEFGLSITLSDQSDLQNISEFYIENGGGFWVSKQGANIVGTIALLNLGGGQYALRKMFVKSGFRGSECCVAKNLLVYAEKWALIQKKATAIYLGTTERFVAAHKFYRKNGYIELDESMLPTSFPVMFVDKLFFTKALTSR
ncbi:MAG TPA: GNAT family N-acetyltransferase [Cellvibrionaceae bacterium]